MTKTSTSSNNISSSADDIANNSSSFFDEAGKEKNVFEKAGWLYKWTNYVKGYRQRWFVIGADAILRYYRLKNNF